MLARHPDADPVTVADHARLGGDLELAARSLRTAAERAAERFDHAAAEALLDDALRLHPDPEGWLERARVRTRRRRYAEALADVELAADAGAAALEVGAWACYFDRRFAQAAQFAADGALAAADPAIRSRCLAVGGRTRHAAGDLARAEMLLGEAFALAEGADRVTAAAWLGVLRAHQAKTEEALALLRPAARAREGVAHTAATLHSLLFTGHAHAAAGRPALALDAFSRYTAEVERRQVPRFAGRAVNFAGWVLRSLGAAGEADDHHRRALELGQSQGTVEVTIAALEDLAEQCVEAGDAGGAQDRLAQARTLLTGDLVLGWRLELKYQLLTARLALLRGDAEAALAGGHRPGEEGDRARGAAVRQRGPRPEAPGLPGAEPARGPRDGGRGPGSGRGVRRRRGLVVDRRGRCRFRGPWAWPTSRPPGPSGWPGRPGDDAGSTLRRAAGRALGRLAGRGPMRPAEALSPAAFISAAFISAAGPPGSPASPTTRVPRHIRPGPSPSRTGPGRPAGTAPTGGPTTVRC